jgi:alpha-L-rhamnosidase
VHIIGSEITRRRFVELASIEMLLRSVGYPMETSVGQKLQSPAITHLLSTGSAIHEPYALLHGGQFEGQPVLESPDPLVRYRWNNPDAADSLQIYALSSVALFTETPASFRTARSRSGQQTPITVEGIGSIRFDFGVESAAWLEFDSSDLIGSVEMSISEYDEPAIENTGPPHRFKTSPPQRYGDTYRLELNPELYEGVRFGWIHVMTFEHPWHITAVRVVCQVKPTNYVGSFSCSDPMLTRIWYMGAYSVKANFCKDYFGALLMDRGDRISWTGDAHPAQAAALVSFGNWDFIKQNLERSATTNNGIESYSLYWVLSLLEYYRHTGDQATFEKYLSHTAMLLGHAANIYTDPPITFYGWDERLGAGFEDPNRFETKSAYRMLFIRACMEFASALTEIGQPDLSKTYQEMARQKMIELRRDERWYSHLGVHALADAVNTQLMTEEEKSAIFAQEFSDRLNCLSFSPFNQYFILQAMALMDRYDEAMVSLRDVWGGQIKYGGTMFFETYTPSWNQCLERNGAVPNCQAGYTSLGHAWGAGVTAWLSREVLGIKLVGPGFSEIEIIPHLGRTLTWVSGSVPTPHGIVHFSFDQSSGRGEAIIPPHVKCRIGIPGIDRIIHKVILNGHLLWNGELHKNNDVGGVAVNANYLYLNDVRSGRYEFVVSYGSRPLSFTQEPLIYPLGAAREDIKTSGNWGGIYGRDGYVLFNYDGVKNDRYKLPPYVISVQPSSRKNGGCLHAQLSASTEDQRAPAADRENGRIRNVGQLYTGDPIACQQTMTVDVEVVEGHRYSIALYFVDWDRMGRRQAIEVFDLKTLNRLAPVEIVKDFEQGKYLIYDCAQSVRFRVDQIRGKNAVLNAIFFDSVSFS